MASKIEILKTELQKLKHSQYAGTIASNSKITRFTGNFQGNWISNGYAIRDSMNIIEAGSFEEIKECIEEEYRREKMIYTIKALKINDIKSFPLSSEDLEGFFDDNGGEPDGNAYIIPLKKLPENFQAENYGEIVDVSECYYSGENLDTKGKIWMGIQNTNIAYIVQSN